MLGLFIFFIIAARFVSQGAPPPPGVSQGSPPPPGVSHRNGDVVQLGHASHACRFLTIEGGHVLLYCFLVFQKLVALDVIFSGLVMLASQAGDPRIPELVAEATLINLCFLVFQVVSFFFPHMPM